MKLKNEHINALRALRTLDPRERLQAMWDLEHEEQHAAEQAKDLGTVAEIRLSDEEWASFKLHLFDGGGSQDTHAVMRMVLQAVFDDDQPAFWRELIHLLKSAGKHLGIISVQGDAVAIAGVGPTLPPITG